MQGGEPLLAINQVAEISRTLVVHKGAKEVLRSEVWSSPIFACAPPITKRPEQIFDEGSDFIRAPRILPLVIINGIERFLEQRAEWEGVNADVARRQVLRL